MWKTVQVKCPSSSTEKWKEKKEMEREHVGLKRFKRHMQFFKNGQD